MFHYTTGLRWEVTRKAETDNHIVTPSIPWGIPINKSGPVLGQYWASSARTGPDPNVDWDTVSISHVLQQLPNVNIHDT